MKTNIPMLILISRSVSRQISPSLMHVCIEKEIVRTEKFTPRKLGRVYVKKCLVCRNFPYEIRKVELAI